MQLHRKPMSGDGCIMVLMQQILTALLLPLSVRENFDRLAYANAYTIVNSPQAVSSI